MIGGMVAVGSFVDGDRVSSGDGGAAVVGDPVSWVDGLEVGGCAVGGWVVVGDTVTGGGSLVCVVGARVVGGGLGEGDVVVAGD